MFCLLLCMFEHFHIKVLKCLDSPIYYINCYFIYYLFHCLLVYICEFSYLVKFICNPQVKTFVVIYGHAQSIKKFESTSGHGPQVKQDDVLPFWFSSPLVNKCPFHGLFNAPVSGFFFLCFLLVILLFKMIPKQSAEMF